MLKHEIDKFVWAPGHLVWADPAEIAATGRTTRMPEALYRRLGRLETELLIESPYFVPRDRGVERLKELHDQGVRVRVLTNSLASNDVLAGPRVTRSPQASAPSGVELHELRAEPG